MEEVYIFFDAKNRQNEKKNMDLSYDWVVHERLLKFE